jgi:hypothetical protein
VLELVAKYASIKARDMALHVSRMSVKVQAIIFLDSKTKANAICDIQQFLSFSDCTPRGIIVPISTCECQ